MTTERKSLSPHGPQRNATLRSGLPLLIDAARFEVERRLTAEAEAVGGEIAASRLWFELDALGRALSRCYFRAEQIERLVPLGR